MNSRSLKPRGDWAQEQEREVMAAALMWCMQWGGATAGREQGVWKASGHAQ